MHVDISPPGDRTDAADKRQGSLFELQKAGADLLPRSIKAEANFLKLPLFALHTKGLKTLDGIQCTGTVTRNDETHEFTLIASRSTRTLYPGPLARRAHLAFLSLATERGFPLENPIAWSWRDLCRRMGIGGSGRDIAQLKGAIKSTTALFIESNYAIYSKSEGRMLRTQEEGLRLYDRYAFIGSELPDGTLADTNYLWFASWYLDNLNAMFTAPLDYRLWRYLEDRSAIASRLYEFLLINFYSGTPKLRINYEKLAQFLPVKPEKYRSQAKRQLEQAFELLQNIGILDSVTWTDAKSGIAQLHLYRGPNLTPSKEQSKLPIAFTEEEFSGSLEVKELRTQKPAEWGIVADFYRLWEGATDAKPTAKELEQAQGMIEQHGHRKAKDLVAKAVKRMKDLWPEAKTFGAMQKYLPQVSDEYDAAERKKEQEHQEQLRIQREREEREREAARQATFAATWQPVWDGLPASERDAIRESILASKRFLEKTPSLLERMCLARLAEQQEASLPPDPSL
jgi:hypothetical protein